MIKHRSDVIMLENLKAMAFLTRADNCVNSTSSIYYNVCGGVTNEFFT